MATLTKQLRFDDEFDEDWEDVRSGRISFKIFADRWLPYIPMNKESEFRAQNIQLTDCWPPCN